MVIPAALAYAVAMTGLVCGRLRRAVDAERGKGTQPRQAWLWALITHQRRLWAPLLIGAAVLLMGLAHAGSGSRGGTAALLLGLSVASAGIARGGSEPGRARRWAAAALVLGAASAASVALWLAADATPSGAVEAVDVSLPSRLAVSVEGSAIVRDHPLFGTGLGSWLHAFRPYQAPPVEGGIWDHAHNDYLEAAAENGVVGVAFMMLFALAVLRATRREQLVGAVQVRHGPYEPATADTRSFELPEWRAALGEHALLRCGLAGGVAAVLAHSLVDFGLHMPANFLALMAFVALLVLSGRPQRVGGTGALGLLLVLLAAAAGPQVANSARMLAGASPLSARDCLEKADLALAEEGDRGRALGSAAGGERTAIVEDLASLLEARGQWREAAAALQAEAGRNAEVSGQLARAARDYLKADDKAAAEQALRAALERAPERGDLYRTLAVDVYAARGDFPAAESVLQAGERNALDMLPVYEGVTEVLARRESIGVEKLASAEPPPRASGDAEVVP